MNNDKSKVNKVEEFEIPEENILPEITYLGIIQKNITAVGKENGEQFPYGEHANITYSSGSIKNYSSSTTTVRFVSSSFDGGFADINMAQNDVVVFKRLLLQSIYAPGSPYNSGITPNLTIVVTPFIAQHMSAAGPEIELS